MRDQHSFSAVLVVTLLALGACSDGSDSTVAASAAAGSGAGGSSTSATGGAGGPNGPLAGTVFGTSFELVDGAADETNGTIYVTLADIQHECDFSEQKPDSYIYVIVTIPAAAQSEGLHPLGYEAGDPFVTANLYGPGPTMQQSAIVRTGMLSILSLSTSVKGTLAIDSPNASLDGAFDASLCPAP